MDDDNADPVAARSEARALIARALDRGVESRLGHGCLSLSVYVVLCR
jgi:predicted amidohydrolase